MKKLILAALSILFMAGAVFAENFPLLDKSRESGFTLYYDSLSEAGILEKNGHYVSFQVGDKAVLFDGMLLSLTDAPEISNNQVVVSQKFMDDSVRLFEKSLNTPSYKVGVILIDPGHGGKDPGAMKSYTVNGKKVDVIESEVNLKVGKLLYDRLKAYYPDKKIIMTRSTDKFVSLGERTDIANAVSHSPDEAVLFISIHVNSSLNKTASGYEVWYLSPGYRRNVLDDSSKKDVDDPTLLPIINSMMEEAYTTESIMIAKFIMDGLQTQIGKESTSRGIKAEEWFVVKNALMPSVLIELGFVSNEKEALNLNDDKYLQKASLGIYNGIVAFTTHFERSRGFTVANED